MITAIVGIAKKVLPPPPTSGPPLPSALGIKWPKDFPLKR